MPIRLFLMIITMLFSSGHLEAQPDGEPVVDNRPRFYSEDLSEELKIRMQDVSYHVGAPVQFSELQVVHVAYVDFENHDQQGQLVVHRSVADEMQDIFKELYEARYPIAGIQLIEAFGGDDNLSMAANNTSAFNHRVVEGSTQLSLHAYGLAIDINPLQNPYVTSSGVYPPTGVDFVDRKLQSVGMILKGDVCYNAFISRGWQWGGAFNSVKDYQHFQKKNKDLMLE